MTAPTCQITVPTIDPAQGPGVGDIVVWRVVNGPFVRTVDGAVVKYAPQAVKAVNGTATLTLPQGSYFDPALQVEILAPGPQSGAWSGVVPSVAGPLTLETLKNSWSWGLVSSGVPVQTITGAPGMNPRGTYDATATYAINDVTFYQGATYIALAINGPQNGGAVTPGTNSAVWQTVAQAGFIAVPAPANQVYAGPTSGGNATPAVRALVPADLPSATTSTQGAAVKTATLLSDFASLAAALTALGSVNPGHLVIHQTVSACPAATIPANVTLEFRNGATLQPASGQTITHNGAIIAPPVQIFDTSLGGTIKLAPIRLSELWIEWFGAKGDANLTTAVGTTDSTVGVQAAFNASTTGQGIRIRLAGGYYRITSTIDLRMLNNQLNLQVDGTSGRPAGGSSVSSYFVWDGPTSTWAPVPSTWLGTWVSGKAYAVGAIVSDKTNGLFYINTVAITGNTVPSADPGHWTATTAPDFTQGILTSTNSGTSNGPTWTQGTTYAKGFVVTFAGRYWVALQAIVNDQTSPDQDQSNWSPADPMFLALTRECIFDGIGFTVIKNKRLFTTMLIDKDFAKSTPCTKMVFRECEIGCPQGNGSANVTYGQIVGLFNNPNCDQFQWLGCDFNESDWAQVYIPNTTGQAKEHRFEHCDFNPGISSVSFFGVYIRTGSCDWDSSHAYNFYRPGAVVRIESCVDPVMFRDTDCEACQQFCFISCPQSAAITFLGGRYTGENVPLATPATGSQYFYANGTVTMIGVDAGDASVFAFQRIGTGLSGTFINTILPNTAPFDVLAADARWYLQGCGTWPSTGYTPMDDQWIGSNVFNTTNAATKRIHDIVSMPVNWQLLTPQPVYAKNNPSMGPNFLSNATAGGFIRQGVAMNWYCTYVTAAGETSGSLPFFSHSSVGTLGQPNTATYSWQNLPLGPAGTTTRRIYRAATLTAGSLSVQASSAQNQATLQAGQGTNYLANDWLLLTNGATKEAVCVLSVAGDVLTFTGNLANTYPIGSTVTAASVLAGTINDNTTTTFNDTALGTGVVARPTSDTSGFVTGQLGNFKTDMGQATSATAGANGAPPAQVDGYVEITVNGVIKKIPYYGN